FVTFGFFVLRLLLGLVGEVNMSRFMMKDFHLFDVSVLQIFLILIGRDRRGFPKTAASKKLDAEKNENDSCPNPIRIEFWTLFIRSWLTGFSICRHVLFLFYKFLISADGDRFGIAPKAFYIVIFPNVLLKNVHHYTDVIHEHPLRIVSTFN